MCHKERDVSMRLIRPTQCLIRLPEVLACVRSWTPDADLIGDVFVSEPAVELFIRHPGV